MANGKPAGVRCVNLDERNLCRLFGQASRPAVCLQFQAEPATCGHSREQALQQLLHLEQATGVH